VNKFNKKNTHTKSQKGHRGFIKMYKVLGDTTHIRIPVTISDKIRELAYDLEVIAQKNNVEKVNEVLDSISEILKWYK
jgi:hypothetical protein